MSLFSVAFNFVLLSFFGAQLAFLSDVALADDEPTKGYDPEKTAREQWDPLKRDYSVNEAKNQGGLYAGGKVGFGLANSTEEGSDAGLFYRYGGELGYVMGRGPWSRVQIGGELFRGSAKFRFEDGGADVNADLDINLGAAVSAGYGYSLGQSAYGVFTLAAGPVLADFSGKTGGVKFEAADSLSGLYLHGGWLAYFPMSDLFEVYGGVEFAHLEIDVDEVKSSGQVTDFDRPVIINAPQAVVGLRLTL